MLSRKGRITDYVIGGMNRADWDEVRAIYLEGIAGGNATFEVDAPDWDGWDTRYLRQPRLVARAWGVVVGWAALAPVSSRSVYAGVAEFSLYVDAAHRRRGIGSALLHALIDTSEKAGIWTLQSSIFPENTASLALVREHGFRQVGRRERIGRMAHGPLAGTWRDVILIERRSELTGAD